MKTSLTHKTCRAGIDDEKYTTMLQNMQAQFNRVTSGKHLFVADAYGNDLFAIYLKKLPAEVRQHYNCRCCAEFLRKYGKLVVVDPITGETTSALFSDVEAFAYDYHIPAFNVLKRTVEATMITGVFVSDSRHLGVSRSGGFEHLSVYTQDPKHLHPDPEAAIIEKREAHKTLYNGIHAYRRIKPVVPGGQLKAMLSKIKAWFLSDRLYSSDKFLPVVEFLLEADRRLNNTSLFWLWVVENPSMWCSFKSSPVGALIDDLIDKAPATAIKNFNTRVAPDKYLRPTAPSKEGTINQAEKFFSARALAHSLRRRYLKPSELRGIIWKAESNRTLPDGKTMKHEVDTSLFAELRCVNGQRRGRMDLQCAAVLSMSWNRFRKNIIPEAMGIYIKNMSPLQRYPFAGLLTAAVNTAPPLLRWDTEESRNPVSWYVRTHGGYPKDWNCRHSDMKITHIVDLPYKWGAFDGHFKQEGVILILESCYDKTKVPLSLFPEILKGELNPVRSVIENYSKIHTVEGLSKNQAAGILLTGDNPLTLEVTMKHETKMTVTIDRWD